MNVILTTVINDCRAYCDSYFQSGIIMGIAFILFYSGILLIKSACRQIVSKQEIFYSCIKIPFVALLGFYGYMVLGVTIFSRSEASAYIINWLPFSTWGTSDWHLTLWVENIFMLVPSGILLYILLKPFRKIRWSLLAGFIFSLSIECIQLYTRRGKFETDDIINNVFGMMIGFLISKVFNRILVRFYTYVSEVV